jgi:hypothetical protein
LIYDGLDGFYVDLDKQIIQALEQEAIEIRETMFNYIQSIYDSYSSPTVYNRTMEFLNSAKITPVQNNNGEYYIEIYISEEVHSPNGWYPEEKTLSEIADYFAEGYGYGRNGGKFNTMETINEEYIETGKALKDMLNYLRKNFDIK